MKPALKKMYIEHLLIGHSAQRQQDQSTDTHKSKLFILRISSVLREDQATVPDVMAINIINANYILLQEVGSSRNMSSVLSSAFPVCS